MLTSNRHFVVKSKTQKVIPRCGGTIRGEITMLNVETEPLVIAFKREVAKMRHRDAIKLENSSGARVC